MDIRKLINEYTQLGFTSIIEKGFSISELEKIKSKLKVLVFKDLKFSKKLVIKFSEYNYPAEYANDHFKYWLNTIQGYYERKNFLTDLENYIKEKTVNNTIDVLFEKLKSDFERTPPIDINYKISILEQEIEKNLPKYKNAIDNRFTQTPNYSLNSEYGFVAKIKFLNYLKQLQGNAPKPEPIVESPFSVLEWSTIFYYADETKLLPENRHLKIRLEQFMSKHQVNTTFGNFKNSYYEAKRRINKNNDYPINKLDSIIPFLKENYKQTVTKVENDIIFLEENKPDY